MKRLVAGQTSIEGLLGEAKKFIEEKQAPRGAVAQVASKFKELSAFMEKAVQIVDDLVEVDDLMET